MYTLNQDFAIDSNLASQLKEQVTPQARLYNWNLLCNQLDVSLRTALSDLLIAIFIFFRKLESSSRMTSRASTWPETLRKSAGSSCESKSISSGSPATPMSSASRTTAEMIGSAAIWVALASRTSQAPTAKSKDDEACKRRRRSQSRTAWTSCRWMSAVIQATRRARWNSS